MNESTNQQEIKIYAVEDTKIDAPKKLRIQYYRNGNYVQYKGEIKSDLLFTWIEDTVEKKTFRLDDSSLEHDTQASTGATTGDWFVLL